MSAIDMDLYTLELQAQTMPCRTLNPTLDSYWDYVSVIHLEGEAIRFGIDVDRLAVVDINETTTSTTTGASTTTDLSEVLREFRMPYRLYTGTKTRVCNTRDDVGTKGLDEHGSEDGSLHPFGTKCRR